MEAAMLPEAKSRDEPEEFRAYPKSVQPGIPTLGAVPVGWQQLPMGDLLTVVQRPARMVDEETYQLVTARRNRGGIIARERLRGAQIATKTQFWVKTGDFVMSRRQIAHGACGILPETLDGALVSNEYASLLPTENLDRGFLRHLPHSIYFQQTCFHSSIGVHVEKLVFNLEHWLTWPFLVPPLPEQRRIAAVLDTWDAAIAAAERLIEAKRSLERRSFHVMSALWDTVPLSSFGRFVGGGTPSKARPDFWGGPISWVSSKDMGGWEIGDTQDTITEEAVEKSAAQVVPTGSVLTVVRSGILRHTVPVAVATRPVAINQDIKALIVSAPYSGALIGRILVLVNERLRGATVKTGTTVESIDLAALREFEIPFPDADDAEVAEAVLLDFRREHELETSRAEFLREQKRGLMQLLLTGKLRVPVIIDELVPFAPVVDTAA